MFNGSKGTVVGFGYRGEVASCAIPQVNTFHRINDREISIKMDVNIDCTVDELPNVIPFTAIADNVMACKTYFRMHMPFNTCTSDYNT
jgi:hypothetical protein